VEASHPRIRELLNNQEPAYVIWDESLLEKSESLKAEGLCAVRSTKAARLKRIKPGYFNPLTDRPSFVPGFNWLQILVTGLKGAPVLAHLFWWTTRGEKASKKRVEEGKILRKVTKLMRTNRHSHLGSRLCWQSVDIAGAQSPSAFYSALEPKLSFGWTRWSQTRGLEDRSWQALLAISHDLGRPPTLLSQDRRDCVPRSFTR
jgi:hypothetical protein